MKKIVLVNTSENDSSQTKSFLLGLQEKLNLNYQVTYLSLSDLDRGLEDVLQADCLVLGLPIYYGSLSGKGKAFMEEFYDKNLRGKTLIPIFSSSKRGQAGIGLMVLLPWVFKEGLILKPPIDLDHGMTEDDFEEALNQVSQALKDKHHEGLDIRFSDFTCLGKTYQVPMQVTYKRKEEV